MKINAQELKQLASQLMRGQQVMFNEVTGEDAVRNMIKEAVGGEWSFRNFEANKHAVFSIVETILDGNIGTILTNEFDNLAEIRNVALGEQASFTVEDASLFRVARIASGTNDLRRQKLTNRRFHVETDWDGVKIYAELETFMAGRVDFAKWTQRVATSFVNNTAGRIYNAIATSYGTLGATYGVKGAYDEDALLDLIQHIEAKSGKKAVVYGTRKALRKVSKAINLSNGMKDDLNKAGFIDEIAGTPLYLLPQVHKQGTDEFAIDDNMLLVIPEGEKIVKIVIEGDALMVEVAGAGQRVDNQMEYLLQKKTGVGVVQTAVYGIYKTTAV